MKSELKILSEFAAKANDLFYSKFEHIDTIMGIMDKTLRNQGMKADAITIDCITLDKKIVMLSYDDKPELVDIALGNKKGDIFSSSKHELSRLSAVAIMDIMEEYFIVK